MPPNEAVCITCLAVDVPLIAIAGTPLQIVFEKLTNTKLLCSKQCLESACYLCHAQLRRCHKFMVQAARAEAILTDILKTSQVTKETVSVVDRVAAGLCPPLAVTGTEIVDSTVPVLIEIKIEQETENADIDIEEGSLGPPDSVYVDVPATGPETDDGLSHLVPLKQEHVEGTFPLENKVAYVSSEDIHLTSSPHEAPPVLDIKMENIEEGSFPLENKAAYVSSEDIHLTSSPHEAPPDLDIKMENIEEDEEWQSSMSSSQLDPEPGARTQEDWSQAPCDRVVGQHAPQTSAGHGKNVSVDTGKKVHECNICYRRYSRRHHLRSHYRIHTGEKPYKCIICERSFTLPSQLKIHSRVHTGEKPHQCNVCQRQFADRADLRNHKRIHTEKKPFGCNECQKYFTKKSTLNEHVRTHHGGEYFECNDCHRRLINKSALRRHLKTHSVKVVICKVCNRRFKNQFNLNLHLNSLNECKLFECNVCKRQFTRVSSMRRHTVNMHPEVTTRPP